MQLVSIRLMAQPGKMSKSGHKCKALNFLSSISEEDILLETQIYTSAKLKSQLYE